MAWVENIVGLRIGTAHVTRNKCEDNVCIALPCDDELGTALYAAQIRERKLNEHDITS
jgi:hypothetical protein